MMSTTRSLRASFAVAAAVALAACGGPPNEAISAADQSLLAAEAAGAAEYAPEAHNAAVQAKAALDAELTVQGERMALRRSYGQAEELAVAYQTAVDQAAAAATAANEEARNDATLMIAVGRASVVEVRAMLAGAPVGKGSAADLAALRTDLETAELGLTEAEAAFAEGRYLEAKSKATSSQELVDGVKAAVEMARGIRAG